MYTESGTITNAIGHPPRVDVYIRDQRPASETTPYGDVDYGEGSYVPVSLEWNPNQSGSDDSPKWQADRTNGIAVNGNQIRVTVGNRGSQRAINVQVSVWFCLWPPGAPPNWDSAAWTACNPSPSAAQSVDPGAHITFGPFTFAPPPSRYLVLAEATCPDDRANTDSAPLLPCSLLPTPLLDLVANDNNLGLLVLGQNA
jgi:hypothetical protein